MYHITETKAHSEQRANAVESFIENTINFVHGAPMNSSDYKAIAKLKSQAKKTDDASDIVIVLNEAVTIICKAAVFND